MAAPPTLFVFVTAAGAARDVPTLLQAGVTAGWLVYTVTTPNIEGVISPDAIHGVPGCQPICGYSVPPLDRFPFGTMLVAPCTFNTLNKLAHGLADNLATAMVADALGAACPVFIAPALNWGLWQHPQTRHSLERLQSWGCQIIPPRVTEQQVVMASLEDILERLRAHFGA